MDTHGDSENLILFASHRDMYGVCLFFWRTLLSSPLSTSPPGLHRVFFTMFDRYLDLWNELDVVYTSSSFFFSLYSYFDRCNVQCKYDENVDH